MFCLKTSKGIHLQSEPPWSMKLQWKTFRRILKKHLLALLSIPTLRGLYFRVMFAFKE